MMNSTYATTDIAISAFLLARGCEFLGSEKKTNGDIAFHFQPEAKSHVSGYLAGESVPAVRFWAEIRRLKQIIFSV